MGGFNQESISFEIGVLIPPIIGTINGESITETAEGELIDARAGDDIVAGGLGHDEILGGDGDDVLRGDLNNASTQGNVAGGNDIIHGGNGNDRIGGKTGDDSLFGDAGDDHIWGDDGDDLLRSGLGNDTLTGDNFSGGQGGDIFVLTGGEGTDKIKDFEVGIDFIGLADGLTFGALSLSSHRQDTFIHFGEEILAKVENVTALTESNFVVL